MAKKKRSKTRTKKKSPANDSAAAEEAAAVKQERLGKAVQKLDDFYELGQSVLKADRENCKTQESQKNKKPVYSTGVIVEIADDIGMSGDYVHKARNFAATYTPGQFRKLKNRFRPDGMPLGRRHIISLMRIKDVSQREENEQSAVTEGWSINQIAAEVSKLFKQPGGSGGRKPQRAVDVDGALMQIVKMTNHWGRWYDAYVPFEDATEDEQVVLDDLPNATREQLRLVTQQIDELKAKAERSLMKLREQ